MTVSRTKKKAPEEQPQAASAGGKKEESKEETKEEEKEQEEDEDSLDESSPFRPLEPKFGGLTQIGEDSFGVWVGGKPKSNFTELADPDPSLIHPNQYRPTSISAQAKSQAYRIKGLETKYSRGADLHTFQKDVMDHLEDHGLDTITYLADPTKIGTMVSIVTG